MKLTTTQLKKLEQTCQKHGFFFCVLFGSAVTENKAKTQRDYDLAFYAGKAIPGDLKHQIYKELYSHFDKPVDIILIQPLMDPLLVYEISHKGKLLYEAKTDSFIEFQSRAWKDYLDSQKYRDYEKKYIKKKVKNVT